MPKNSPNVRTSVRSPQSHKRPTRAASMPWWLAAVAGAGAVALGGWLIVAGLVVAVWLGAMAHTFIDAVGVGTNLWLLAHGGTMEAGPLRITLVPLGLTLVVMLMLAQASAYATSQALAAEPSSRMDMTTATWRPALLLTAVYAAILTLVATLFVSPLDAGRVLLITIIVGLAGSFAGSFYITRLPVTRGWPDWLRTIPRAGAAGAGVAVLAGLAAMVGVLVVHGDSVMTLQRSLKPGGVGVAALVILQLLYAPNFIIWAVSYVLGGGFTIGNDSVVSIASTHVGMLPGIPAFGAVPTTSGRWYLYCWLLSGVLAGAVAAWVAVRDRQEASIDECALAGALAGLMSIAVLLVLAAISRGALAPHRMAELGPRLMEMATVGGSLLGLSGAVMGAGIGLWRSRGDTDSESS